ncbi:hypothetical protein CC86DRAFT_408554 [Ophiobolus disseminans]|uniref:CBM-cenC domain-containing protein n=1 Tax=Ophiobolus disseminans TaxID=1469910 RepID=A0A6A6ZUQ5_9PLEO|nr:hypothetical protein CC86DRAFT_408554 [Ophiobolus disseminans]
MDAEASGVKPGNGRTGTNAFTAVGISGSAPNWFADIVQMPVIVPNTSYRFELWAKSVTPGCTVQVQVLGRADGIDTTTSYRSISVVIPAAEVTPELIAQTQSTVLVDIFCIPGDGPNYAVYVDDITLTIV